jgi:hypothetical protein
MCNFPKSPLTHGLEVATTPHDINIFSANFFDQQGEVGSKGLNDTRHTAKSVSLAPQDPEAFHRAASDCHVKMLRSRDGDVTTTVLSSAAGDIIFQHTNNIGANLKFGQGSRVVHDLAT